MATLDTEYLEYIAQQIFPGNAPPEFQYHIFLERFNSNNYPLLSNKIGTTLAKIHDKNGYSEGMSQHLREVIKKIINTFRDELKRDNVLELLDKKRGNGAIPKSDLKPWEIVYDWLWTKKVADYIWQTWKQKANNTDEWIRFHEIGSKAIKIPEAKQYTLPVNTPLQIKINVDSSGNYLLLFNIAEDKNKQGEFDRHLLAPSNAFAPNYQLAENSISIPQQDADAKEIEFDTEGREEFMAIVIDEPLDLSWLKNNHVLEWEGKHLVDLWEKLAKKNNWQIFYRNYEIRS